MNTDTGRIYDLDALGVRENELRHEYASLRRAPFEFSDPFEKLTAEDERTELLAAARLHKLVPVSGDVAHTMKLGQRELERRAKRRRAVKDARKRNR